MTDEGILNGTDTGNTAVNSSEGKGKTWTSEEDISNGKDSFLYRIRNDTVFRTRTMHTAFVWWAFVTMVSIIY